MAIALENRESAFSVRRSMVAEMEISNHERFSPYHEQLFRNPIGEGFTSCLPTIQKLQPQSTQALALIRLESMERLLDDNTPCNDEGGKPHQPEQNWRMSEF
jgi:hypothetical protein